MFTKLLTLSALCVAVHCLSIGTVSEQNVTKREANTEDLFPDWVPFKNKHGDELGEFVQVEKKNKVKKRLAAPINFLLRPAVEPENDDYYYKNGGESDSDNYESKDWSDLHRTAVEAENQPINVNHTDISDIDGVVDIIVNGPPNPIVEAIYKRKNKNSKEVNKNDDKGSLIENPVTEQKESNTSNENEAETLAASASEENENHKKDSKNSEESGENDESVTENAKKAEEDRENEEKKAKILSGVDELKQRHEQEQSLLSERIRGEELFVDEFERDKSSDESLDKSSSESPSSEQTDEYEKSRQIKTTTEPDYDDYDGENASVEDKYKIKKLKPQQITIISTTEEPNLKKKTFADAKKVQKLEPARISVFKNPNLYVLHDDPEESGQTYSRKNSGRGPKKFSSRYTTDIPDSNNEGISQVSSEVREREPAPFHPKQRKTKRKKKFRTTTTAYDSTGAETATDNYKQTTAIDVTAPDSNTEDKTEIIKSQEPDTTGTDSVSVRTDPATDAEPAPSNHKKEHQKEEDYHREKGGGQEHHAEHSEEHEEHGKKAYEGHHEDTKTAKGHHDKENHLGKYDDHGGVEKHHSEESGHYGDHHHEEHGKKHAKYEESGKHSKGHSTKGSHDIHKKEEYEKKVEFFEEEGDSAEEEKHGGYNHEKEHAEGGKFGKSNLHAGHHQQHKGEAGHYHKGGHHHVAKGHKQANGYDGHGKTGKKHFHEEGKEGGRKWIFHHGHPAKTANLVVIDRSGFDQMYHGPYYYG